MTQAGVGRLLRRGVGYACAVAVAAALGGCAVLSPTAVPTTAPTTAAEPATPRASAARLEVDAPAPLKALLEQHLDLARVGGLTRDETIDDVEWSRLIDATPAQVRSLLQTEGYFSPTVTLQREAASAGATRRVRLALDPGPRTRVSRVTIEAEGELERDASAGDAAAVQTLSELRRRWEMPPDTPFRNADWTRAKQAALAQLRSAGYALAAWSGTGAEVDPESTGTRLFLVADSGPLFRFGRLQVEGLKAHDLETVRNLAAIEPGTPLAEALLLDYQERLQKSGLFDTVSVTLDPDPAQAANAAVVVRLREAPLQVYTVGVGVSANTGPRASVEHVHRRLLGYAATARNKVEWGRLRQAWDGEIATHPGEGLYRNLLGAALERLESDSDIVLAQRVRLGRSQDTPRFERFSFVEAERSKRTLLTAPRSSANTLALSVNHHAVWRALDNAVLPTEGFTLSLQGGVGHARGTDSDNGPFTRLYGRLTGYLPVGRRWYGQARVELGQVVKRKSVAVPQSQLFRAGGDDSVRGYGYRSLGPLVDGVVSGGAVLFTASAELARPLSDSLPSLWGAGFVDIGRAADSFKGFDPAVGLGVGLRWRSPVGPLRLDWAWGRELRKARLHFSVGIAF